MTARYDELTDVLYLTFAEACEPVFYMETTSGDLLRIEQSGRVVGCTIEAFMLRHNQSGKVVVPELDGATAAGLDRFVVGA